MRGLSKRYGAIQALAGVDLDVAQGEVFGFLGPNGAGKTTFTKCVTGFVRPASGEVRLFGIDSVRTPHKAAPLVGLVPDQYDFYGNLTGRQHLDFYGRLMRIPAAERRTRIDEVLALVGMSDRADRRVKGYSHGMKQRICIGQAILHRPKLIIFDEPTNGLDPKGAYELRELIKGLARQGTTIFLNSHVMHEVEQVCDRVAILDQGKIRIASRVEDLRRRFDAGGMARIRVLGDPDRSLAAARSVATEARVEAGEIRFAGDEATVAKAVYAVVRAGGKVVHVEREQLDLESIFLRLTEDA